MRLRVKEVNVVGQGTVPQTRGWIVRLYLWACERLYDELAGWYDAVSWVVSLGNWRRWQSGVWRVMCGRDVLEIGVGTGALLAQGKLKGFNMVGVERSPRMVAVARQRHLKSYHQVPLLQCDGRALALKEQKFDTVMATFPAGYIFDVATLAEVHRVLRQGGRLVILGLWVELHFGKIGRWIPLFYGRPSVKSMAIMAQRVAAAGFRVRWDEQRQGRFTVGVLVAERE